MKTKLCSSVNISLLAALLLLLTPGRAPAQPNPAAMQAIATAHGVFALKTNGSLWEIPGNNGSSADGTHLGPAVRITVDCDGPWVAVDGAYSGRRGDSSLVAIQRNGSLWTWVWWTGWGRFGSETDWRSVATSGHHSLALKIDGSLWAWGENYVGELGIGSDIPYSNRPVRVGSATNWQVVVAGHRFSLALKTDGSLWSWGYWAETNHPSPVQIGTGTNWTFISEYYQALQSDDSLWGLITTNENVLPVLIHSGGDWVVVAGASRSYTALKADGSVWAWGRNDHGQLGDGTQIDRTTPVRIGLENCVALKGQLALLADGTLWTWGGAVSKNRHAPSRIATNENWISAAAGRDVTLAIAGDGSLWQWGGDFSGRIGSDADWKSIANSLANDNYFGAVGHAVALKADGSLWAWGDNGSGQLGDGTTEDRTTPVRIGLKTNWTSLATGYEHTLALRSSGSLWAWGGNWSGQLGLGTNVLQTNVPVRVGLDTDWRAVTAGSSHALGLKSDGTLWAWGGNYSGQLGDGSTSNRFLPVRLSADTNWSTIRAGSSFSLALKSDGSLWAWGANYSGQLGDGTRASKSVPTRIGLDDDWSAIAAGENHSIALKRDGTLWAWGDNWSGQLGIGEDGYESMRAVPTRVGTDFGWASVSAGDSHTVALKTNGDLFTWGSNKDGQLGDTTGLLPLRIGTDSDWGPPPAEPGPFRILSLSIDADGSHRFFVENPPPQSYLILERGWTVSDIHQAVAVTLPDFCSDTPLIDPTPLATNRTAFYRVRAVPLSAPLDLDSDGIDDVFELRHARFLNPLNATDAEQDYDGDGKNNRDEYLAHTNPAFRPGSPVTAGPSLTLALRTDGSLWTLGDGLNLPTAIPGQWGAVSAGIFHTLALKDDGSLWAWGRNEWGVLGDPTLSETPVPARIGTDTDWVTISAGGYQSSAIKADGSLWVWGSYGDQTLVVPTRIGTDNDWATVSCGRITDFFDNYSLALKRDGSLWVATTLAQFERVGTNQDWKAIDSGGGRACGLKTDGSLWLLAPIGNRASPGDRIGAENDWMAMAVGYWEALFLKTDGSLWIQRGGEALMPVGTDRDWVAIAASGDPYYGPHLNIAMKADGTLWTVSTIRNGSVPKPVSPEHRWAQVSASAGFVQAIQTNGTLWAWGYNYSGEFGGGASILQTNPVQQGTSSDWHAATRLDRHTLALKTDGSLWAWGANYSGVLGIGTNLGYTPIPVRVGAENSWLSVAAGGLHSMALKTDGSLWAWGYNYDGRLGDGTTMTNRFFPVRIGTGNDWKEVSAGWTHTAALKRDGSLWTWGYGHAGEFGDGIHFRSVPARMDAANDWSAVAAGADYTMALKTDGSLWAWGNNSSGQLGDGTRGGRPRPVLIAPGSQWRAIAPRRNYGGYYPDDGKHTLAVKSDGTLWAWGSNYWGELGDGTTIDSLSPLQIGTDADWVMVSAGDSHSTGIKADGSLWSWGDFSKGPLSWTTELTRLGTANNWGSPR